MKYIIIGLGYYGAELAERLSALENEVIGVDIDENRVGIIRNKITTSFILDATDENALSVLPLKEVDVVIVAIGESFGASVRIVALLKRNKVRQIYARSIDEVHRSILEAFHIDRILTPEIDAARDLVDLLNFGAKTDSHRIMRDYYVLKFKIPERWIGHRWSEISFDKISVLSLVKSHTEINLLGASVIKKTIEELIPEDYVMQSPDELICYGRYDDFIRFFRSNLTGSWLN